MRFLAALTFSLLISLPLHAGLTPHRYPLITPYERIAVRATPSSQIESLALRGISTNQATPTSIAESAASQSLFSETSASIIPSTYFTQVVMDGDTINVLVDKYQNEIASLKQQAQAPTDQISQANLSGRIAALTEVLADIQMAQTFKVTTQDITPLTPISRQVDIANVVNAIRFRAMLVQFSTLLLPQEAKNLTTIKIDALQDVANWIQSINLNDYNYPY